MTLHLHPLVRTLMVRLGLAIGALLLIEVVLPAAIAAQGSGL